MGWFVWCVVRLGCWFVVMFAVVMRLDLVFVGWVIVARFNGASLLDLVFAVGFGVLF